MTDNEQSRAIDTDLLIGNILHQTEAVVDIDEESLEHRKNQLLAWMASQRHQSRNPARARRGKSGGPKTRVFGSVRSTTWPS